MREKLFRYGGFAALFVVAFIFGLLLTLPMGIIGRVIETQVEKALGFKYDIEIGKVRLAGLNGVRLVDVTITPTREAAPGEAPLTPMIIDRARARVRPLSLLGSRPRGRVDLDIGDGEMSVRFTPGNGMSTRLYMAFENVDLRNVTLVRAAIGMPVQGFLNGTVEVGTEEALDPQAFLQQVKLGAVDVGTIDLSISNLIFGPGDLRGGFLQQVGGFLPLPATDFGTLRIQGTMAEGQLAFEQLAAEGSDIRFGVDEGRLEFNDPFASSRLRLTFHFSLDQAYVDEADLGFAFSRIELLQAANTGDGYALAISGTWGDPGSPQPLGGARGRRLRQP